MPILDIFSSDLLKAVGLLKAGELIGMPTETVYGLAGDATKTQAIAKIYATKNRPSFNPLIIHSHSLESLEEMGEFHTQARELAKHFWPGPLTLVLKRKEKAPIDFLATGGLHTIAVRIPNHPMALELLKTFNRPIAAPSANLSNKISPTTRDMVLRDFPELFVLEGGACTVGLESTIIDLSSDKPQLLRPGGISLKMIEEIIGPVYKPNGSKILAPGMMKKHYAPMHKLRINAFEKKPGEIFIGFGKLKGDFNLSPSANDIEAATNLYAYLQEADLKAGAEGIAIAPIPEHGLGVAINDRLKRAAAA